MTPNALIETSLIFASISAGLIAGVYFAFSAFIMHALDRLDPQQAADAMSSINDVILHSWFMHLFFSSSLVYAMLSVFALLNTNLAGRWTLFAAGVTYVVGMFLCTVLFNVPLNNQLKASSSGKNHSQEYWRIYYKHWTHWNSVRFTCCLMTVGLSLFYISTYA